MQKLISEHKKLLIGRMDCNGMPAQVKVRAIRNDKNQFDNEK